jgi:hypothetical protein
MKKLQSSLAVAARTRTHQENQLHPSAMKLQSRNSTGAVESWSDEFRIAPLQHSTTARNLFNHRNASRNLRAFCSIAAAIEVGPWYDS